MSSLQKSVGYFILTGLLLLSSFFMMRLTGFTLLTFLFFFFLLFSAVLFLKSLLSLIEVLASIRNPSLTIKYFYTFLKYFQVIIGIILIAFSVWALVNITYDYFVNDSYAYMV